MRSVCAAVISIALYAALIPAAAPRLYLTSAVDRQAFSRWFTFMAESRYYARRHAREIGNCADLVRWCFREALITHDAHWARSTELPLFPAMRSVQSPVAAELANAGSTDAARLQHDETWFVSRDVASARPGDLLFYGGNQPEHVMIYLGSSQIVPSAGKWILYMTDPDREVQKVNLDFAIGSWPAEWRAEAENRNFLGVWRFNILKDSD